MKNLDYFRKIYLFLKKDLWLKTLFKIIKDKKNEKNHVR